MSTTCTGTPDLHAATLADLQAAYLQSLTRYAPDDEAGAWVRLQLRFEIQRRKNAARDAL